MVFEILITFFLILLCFFVPNGRYVELLGGNRFVAAFISFAAGFWLLFITAIIYTQKNKPADKNKPTSEMNLRWLGWSIYAIGAIAIGYWFIKTATVEGDSPINILSFICFFIWTVIGGWLMVKVPKQMRLDESPEKTEIVKVISKASKTGGSGVGVFTSYYVTFEVPDGTRKSFNVDIKQYNSVAENEIGTLTYKEHGNDLMFLDFKPHK